MFQFEITPASGETYELKANSQDVLRWEKSGRGRSFNALVDNLHMADLYEVAFYAAKREKHFEGSISEFEDEMVLELSGDDEDNAEPDPTRKAR